MIKKKSIISLFLAVIMLTVFIPAPQALANQFVTPATNWNPGSEPASRAHTVTTTQGTFSINTLPAWLTVTDRTNTTFTLNVSANTGTQRSFTVIISAGSTPIGSFLVTQAGAPASRTLSVIRVRQAQNNWCWAASSEMIGGRKRGSNMLRDQFSVAQFINGSQNLPEIPGNLARGINFAAYDRVNYWWTLTIPSFSDHMAHILRDDPVAILMHNNIVTGHYIVCAGYQISGGVNHLWIIDPWQNTQSVHIEYTRMINGTTSQYGDRFYRNSIFRQ